MLRARLYLSSTATPKATPVHCLSNRRYPYSRPDMRYVMGWASVQSYVHDAAVTVVENGKHHRFIVFTKNHKELPYNLAVDRLVGDEAEWRGDIVVVKRGKNGGLVNFRREHNDLADFAVQQ